MRSGPTATLFAGALWLALFCTALFDVYVLGHFDGVIGNRFDNLKVNAAGDIVITLIATFGFVGYLLVRRIRVLAAATTLRVLLSALLTGVFAYLVSFVGGKLSDLFGYWQLNACLFAALCLAFGSFAAAALTHLLPSKSYAA